MKVDKTLVFFGLEMDNRSTLLQSNIDLLRAFSLYFEDVLVVVTHLGEIPNDLQMHSFIELGGGSLLKRLRAILRLLLVAFQVLQKRNDVSVFHHMSHRTVIFPGMIFRVLGIKQILWYSHHSIPLTLKSASRIVNCIVTPSKFSFPIDTSKVRVIGQAVDSNSIYKNFKESRYKNVYRILSVGRVSRAKKLDKFVDIAQSLDRGCNTELCLVGEVQDHKYLEELRELTVLYGCKLENYGPVDRKKVFEQMTRFCFYFSGTPRGVDRAAIEAAMSGCIVLSENYGTLKLIGMYEFWSEMGYSSPPGLAQQYLFLKRLTPYQLSQIGVKSSRISEELNDVKQTVQRIILMFADLEI